jgi:PAS domain S-box-containing protein
MAKGPNQGRWPDRPDPMMLSFDRSGRIFSTSKGFEDLAHILAKEIIGRDFLDFVHAEDQRTVRRMLESVVEQGLDPSQSRVRLVFPGIDVARVMLKLLGMKNAGSDILIHAIIWQVDEGWGPGETVSYEINQQLLSWPDFITIATDLEGRIIMFSPSAETRTGLNRDEVLGTDITEMIDADRLSISDYSSSVRSVMATGEAAYLDLPLMGKNGSMSLKWRAQPMRDPEGKVIGIMGFGHSLPATGRPESSIPVGQNLEVLAETSTDIVESEDLAEAIDKDLDKLIDSLGVDFAVFRLIGADSKVRMVCAGLDFRKGRKLLESRVVGLGPLYREVQSGETFIAMDAQTDPRIVIEEPEIKSLLCLPIKYKREVYGCAAFGDTRSTGTILTKLPILQVFCNQVGIAVRKLLLKGEVQSKNRELESLYETSMAVSSTLEMQKVLSTILTKATELVQADSVYLFLLDKNTTMLKAISSITKYQDKVDGMVIKVGEGITGIVAQTRQGMLIERADKDARSLLVPGTPDEPSSLISVPLKMGDDLLGVVTLERVPGTPFTETDYRLIEMFSFQASTAIHNASMYNRINEHAAAQQMYNILLTHDVANYNVPIHGYLEMLARDPKLDERQRRFVMSALAQSENISSLISDVRKLSMLRSMETVREFEPIDLTFTTSECVETLRQHTLYEDIEIRFARPAMKAMVNGDAFVKDIVYNLLSNACKYGGEGPIDIAMHERRENDRRYWQLDVKDTGEGVPEDRKDFMFRRFDSLDPGTASEGHGIGLSVVRALCERFEGKVWVEDRAKMDGIKGSVFSVMFPAVPE